MLGLIIRLTILALLTLEYLYSKPLVYLRFTTLVNGLTLIASTAVEVRGDGTDVNINRSCKVN